MRVPLRGAYSAAAPQIELFDRLPSEQFMSGWVLCQARPRPAQPIPSASTLSAHKHDRASVSGAAATAGC